MIGARPYIAPKYIPGTIKRIEPNPTSNHERREAKK
jgi:hypothetical protein